MRAIVVAVGLVAASTAASADQDPLNIAKDLYASAAYEEALSACRAMPGTLARASVSRDRPTSIARSVCMPWAVCRKPNR